jgi:hypothetical protein
MKIINLYKILFKLKKINIYMQHFIENKDGSYDCNTDINIGKCLIYNGKLIINFNKINGDFNCSNNKLKSLKYCPKVVNGIFSCYNNYKQFYKKEIIKKCIIKSYRIYI